MNLKEFGDWALNQGSVANPPPNYKYLGECVSLIQQYLYRVFGIPFQAHAHAKDWAYNIPNGFTKVNSNPQKGDIVVYGANYPGSGGCGQVYVAENVNEIINKKAYILKALRGNFLKVKNVIHLQIESDALVKLNENPR